MRVTDGNHTAIIGLDDVCIIERRQRPGGPIDIAIKPTDPTQPDIWDSRSEVWAIKPQIEVTKISGQISPVPPELTADSEPNIDEWGPDNYWSAGTYILWHQLNKQAYGKNIADAKMISAINEWGAGGVEFDYCYNDNFRNYFTAEGIDVSTIFCSAEQAINNVVDTAQNITGGANNAAQVFRVAAPFLLIGAGLVAYSIYKPKIQEYAKRR